MRPQDGAAVSRRTARGASEDAVVARLEQLSTAMDGEPDPAFRAATRARLVAMAAVRTPAPERASGVRGLLSARAVDAPARWRARLTAGLAAAALTVTGVAAVAAVASTAGPGDLLYGVKRGTEQTQLALASDSTRGRILLDFAKTRIGELEVLTTGSSPDLVLQTLHTMDTQTTEGAAWLDSRSVGTVDPAPLELLSRWAARQSTRLSALEPSMPAAAATEVASSLDLLAGIRTRAQELRTALACASGPAVSGSDALGPVPGPCRATAPPSSSGVNGTSSSSAGSGATGTSATGGSGSSSATPTGTGVPGSGSSSGSGSNSGSGSGSGPGSGSAGATDGVPAPTTLPSPGLPTPTLPTLPPRVTGGPLPTSGLPTISTPTLPGSSPVTVCVGPVPVPGSC